MLCHNHCRLRRQYRFPISGHSFAYLKSEMKVIKTCVIKRMSFILLSCFREKNSALVRVGEALQLVHKKNLPNTVANECKQSKFFSQSNAKSTSILISLPAVFRAKHRLHVFPRSTWLPCFPAHGSNCIFHRAWHGFHLFPRQKTGHVSLRLARVAYNRKITSIMLYTVFINGRRAERSGLELMKTRFERPRWNQQQRNHGVVQLFVGRKQHYSPWERRTRCFLGWEKSFFLKEWRTEVLAEMSWRFA